MKNKYVLYGYLKQNLGQIKSGRDQIEKSQDEINQIMIYNFKGGNLRHIKPFFEAKRNAKLTSSDIRCHFGYKKSCCETLQDMFMTTSRRVTIKCMDVHLRQVSFLWWGWRGSLVRFFVWACVCGRALFLFLS